MCDKDRKGQAMGREVFTADSISQAVALKGPAGAYLAGGTEILRGGSSVPEGRLVMLKKVPGLNGIEMTDDHTVRIGSMATFTKALQDDRVPGYLKTALRYMASATKRNMATIGGNVSLLRDDSYLLAVLTAAHARIELVYEDIEKEGPDDDADRKGIISRDILDAGNGRKLAKEVICTGRYIRLHEAYKDALITAISVRTDIRVASKRYANTAESHSFLTLAIGSDGRSHRAGVSVKNSGVFFLKELSEGIDRGEIPGGSFMEFAKSWEGLNIPDDIYGSEVYKRYLLGVTLADLLRDVDGNDGQGCPADGKEVLGV